MCKEKDIYTKRNRVVSILKQLMLVALFAMFAIRLSAQQSYPVHIGVQAVPPYSLYLTDYYGGSRDRLIVTLFNRDREQQTLQVRLRVKITNSSGFSLQSREEISYPVLTLETGIPLRLTNTDIAPYLIPENTTVQGYLKEGRFPAGMTEFSFQAVEYTTGRPLSAWATGRAWLETKKPPMLNLPQKDEQVAQMQPQYIRFGWMPQHQGLATTEYEFVLKELPDNGVAPQSAFMYGQEIFRTITRFTTLNYTHIEPELIPNRRYGWQVRAVAKDGMGEIGMFENNGFSEIGWFTLNERCPAPMQVRAEGGYRKMTLSWEKLPGQQAYLVQYRPKSEHSLYEWSDIRTFENTLTVYDLKPGWLYEYRVGALCTTEKPVYSLPQEITLSMDDEERLVRCGVVPEISLENQTPNEELRAGDRVIIGGDFPMTVTQASHQGNGWYSGKGKVTLPWIFETVIAVRFDRLRINTDNRQIGGEVESETDPNASQIADLNDLDYGGNRTTPAGIVFVEHTVDFSIPPMAEASFDEEAGELIIYDMNGTPHIVPTEKNAEGESIFPMFISDKDGNRYQVEVPEDTAKAPDDETAPDATGGKTQKKVVLTGIQTLAGNINTSGISSSSPVTVRFSGGGRYALDEGTDTRYQRSVMLSKYYEPFGTGYIAPWKLIPTGKSDEVEAFAVENGKDFERSRVRFSLKDGTEIPSKDEGGKWTLTLPGVGKSETYEVFALYETGKNNYVTAGKLNVVSYPEQQHTVTLVEVDGPMPQTTHLQDKLNSTYNPYGIHFTVQSDGILKGNTSWDSDGDGKLNVSGSCFFSSETGEMKTLRQLYQKTQGSLYDKNSYYLFVMDRANASGEPDETHAVQGDMPRGKQFGYLFSLVAEDPERLAAHELGHGIFTLRHTFDVNLLGSDSKGQTANLMDYGHGTELAVWQWDVMANPAPLTWFDDEEDAMVIVVDGIPLKEEGYFIRPDHKIIKLPVNSKILYSCYLTSNLKDNLEINSGNKSYYLYKFKIGNNIWEWHDDEKGYYCDGKKYDDEGRDIKTGDTVFLTYQNLEGYSLVIYKHRVISVNNSGFIVDSEGLDNPIGVYVTINCFDNEEDLALLLYNLELLNANSLWNQSVELDYWNKFTNSIQHYRLNGSQLEKIDKPLSDNDIQNGNWNDSNVETRIRYTVNNDGIIQIQAFGFQKDLKIATGKIADLKQLSRNIKDRTNEFLLENNVRNFNAVYKEDTETFVDGEKININGKIVKIISEGIGIATKLLKTGEIEENVYKTSTKEAVVIHAPGVVTGSVEVVAQKVADLTSLGCLAYDLAVDKEVRSQIRNQFVEIKNEIGEDPKALLPVLFDVIVTVTLNKTPEEIQSIFDEQTDAGQRTHYAVSSTGNAILTAIEGVAIVKNLPEFAEMLAENIKKVKKIKISFINGWTKKRILALPKGSRPNPSEYLSADYIAEHLAKFDDGAIRITTKSSFNQYGTLGPDGGFVLPKKEFDNILSDAKGNLRIVEKKLGFDENYLSDADVMVVKIEKTEFKGLNIPSGNEVGVNNNWLPGGYTSGGVSEAILNFSSKPTFTEIKLK